MRFWSDFELKDSATYRWSIGTLDFWVQRCGDEWRVASRFRDEKQDSLADNSLASAVEEARPDDLAWRRVLTDGSATRMSVVPMTPDRPLVVRPEAPLVLSHHAKADFFVSVPLFVGLKTASDVPQPVAELPSVALSNTWFGSPTSGELCYSLSTRGRRSAEEGSSAPHCAVCRVSVRNDAPRDLPFARLCLPAPTLGLYRRHEELVTSSVEVIYHAEEEVTRTRTLPGAPELSGVGDAVAEPRMRQRENVLSRGLTTLRSIAGF